jgi:hypothetical protein
MRAYVLAIGTAVLLFGLGTAFWTGYQAHSMTHDDRVLGPEFDTYQVWTFTGVIIASMGIGIVTYGLVFENHENKAGKIPKFAIVIGAVISACGLGTLCWQGLAIEHMEGYGTYGGSTVVGLLVGSLGMAIMLCGLASNPEIHPMMRPRDFMQVPQRQLPSCPCCGTPLVPGATYCPECARHVQK